MTRDSPSLALTPMKSVGGRFLAVLLDQAVEFDQQRRLVLRMQKLRFLRLAGAAFQQGGPHLLQCLRRHLSIRVIHQAFDDCR